MTKTSENAVYKYTAQDIEKMSFEQALKELETIVSSMEGGQTTLDQSVGAYETGILLKNHCEKQLEQARLKIEKISVSQDGTLQTTDISNQEV